MESESTLDKAIKYYELGLSLIPVGKDKKPLLPSWKEYQSQRASLEQIKEWFSNNDVNIAVVTGLISGIAVVDFDLDKTTGKLSNEAINLLEMW